MSEDCKYTTSDINKILSYTSWSDKKKIDTLLHIDCTQYANLGTDSTIGEKKNVRTQSRNIYRAIKSIDESKGKLLLDYMDK
jgi:CRISPR/Cas system CSM-associated protein Csm2 small subunit